MKKDRYTIVARQDARNRYGVRNLRVRPKQVDGQRI